jgi:hypothetical protein
MFCINNNPRRCTKLFIYCEIEKKSWRHFPDLSGLIGLQINEDKSKDFVEILFKASMISKKTVRIDFNAFDV